MANASDMLLSARVLKAEEAKTIGLAHRVVGVDALDGEVMDYAAAIAALSPESLRVTKSMISAYRKGQRKDTPETDAQFVAGFASKDFKEGFRAFLEKRTPDFG